MLELIIFLQNDQFLFPESDLQITFRYRPQKFIFSNDIPKFFYVFLLIKFLIGEKFFHAAGFGSKNKFYLQFYKSERDIIKIDKYADFADNKIFILLNKFVLNKYNNNFLSFTYLNVFFDV